MTDWLLASLFFLMVLNPAVLVLLVSGGDAIPLDSGQLRRWAPGFAVSLLVLAVAALLSENILDILELSLSTFQIATGTLVVFGALQGFLAIGVHPHNVSSVWANAGVLIWMVSPAPVTLAISFAASDGAGFAVGALLAAGIVAVLLAVLWTLWRGTAGRVVLGWLRRLFAAAAVLAAIDLIRQGVENV